jgi:hypothetical protein
VTRSIVADAGETIAMRNQFVPDCAGRKTLARFHVLATEA